MEQNTEHEGLSQADASSRQLTPNSERKITRRRLLRALAYLGGGVVLIGGAGGLWVHDRFFRGYKQDTIEHDGLQREFIYRLPRGYDSDSSHPICLALAPWAMDGRKMSLFMALDIASYADKTGTVVVYPTHVGDFWNDGMGGETPAANTDDTGFLSRLIDHVRDRFNGDPKRVYCLGASNGSVMTHRLACEHPDKLAGIATMVGLMGVDASKQYAEALPVPVLIIQGTEDPYVKWSGAEVHISEGNPPLAVLLSADDTVTYYRKRNRATGAPEITQIPDANTKDGSTVVSYAYSGEAPVVLWKIDGGGHGPPTKSWRPWVSLEGTNRDMNSFFEAFKFLHNFARTETGEIIQVAP